MTKVVDGIIIHRIKSIAATQFCTVKLLSWTDIPTIYSRFWCFFQEPVLPMHNFIYTRYATDYIDRCILDRYSSNRNE